MQLRETKKMGLINEDAIKMPKVTYKVVTDVPSHIKLEENEQFIYLKHHGYHKAEGIAGIISHPKSLQFETLSEQVQNEDEFGLPQHKLVLLVHGHQSHKNSNFQPLLASKLSQIGYFVFRIDFRGLGDSEDCRDVKIGRTISQDVEDIDTVYEFLSLSDSCRELCGFQLSLDAIVAHSRGVISMFEFARVNPEKHIPNLINCAGRFDGKGLLQKRLKNSPEWRKEGGFWCDLPRHGGTIKTWIPCSETLSAVEVDTSRFSEIEKRTWVMSCYGLQDGIIPIDAASNYANLFSDRHTLEFIEGANHNYYGLPGDLNESNLPLRNGVVNYCFVLVEKIANYLGWENQLFRFQKTTLYIHGTISNPADVVPRWPLPYDFSKVSNFRDIGGYETMFHNRKVKTGCVFRCANPCDITKDALKYLELNLRVNRVFDLRANEEALENGIFPIPSLVQNISFNNNSSMSPDVMAEHYQGLLISSYSFPKAYMIVLKNSTNSIKLFFQYILDGNCNAENSLLFHCTAGKDRTGILSMLLLSILGVDNDTIAKEYELTTIGLKTESKLIKKLEARGDLYYTMLGQDSEKLALKYELSPEKMCKTLLSSRYEAMRFFIDQFNEEYKSVEHFFLNELQFTPHEIGKLRDILLE